MAQPLLRLIAPAALGLLAPLAPVGASAAELNLEGINRYASGHATDGLSADQVTSINQFSDLQPTEWAYQALSNLIERYGCVAGYPDGTFRGKQALSRWEAAALLNACLDRITEVTDELRRLLKEFEAELAVLKGRVDGLEAKVGELEANQFSTTTKLSGQATFVVGANAFGGSATSLRDAARQEVGATTFTYDLQLSFDTSFTGKDLLRTILRAGNFGSSAFGGAGPTGSLSTLEVAFQEDAGADVVGIDKLFYQFPIGSGFTATVGGRVGQEDMLALWPSVYPSDTILNVLTLNGAPAAYNKNLGPGAGLWWQNGGFSVSASYVAANGNAGNPSEGGIGTNASAGTGTVQIGIPRTSGPWLRFTPTSSQVWGCPAPRRSLPRPSKKPPPAPMPWASAATGNHPAPAGCLQSVRAGASTAPATTARRWTGMCARVSRGWWGWSGAMCS